VTALSAPAPLVLQPGAGIPVQAGELPVTVKADPALTGGRLLLAEQEIPPGRLVPAHRHAAAAQWCYVIEGTLYVMAGGDVHVVEAGGYFIRPPGTWHAVWNPSRTETARQVEGTTPGEEMLSLFLRMEELKNAGLLTPASLAEAAAPLGTAYDPAATAEIEKAYGVSAGQGWQE
jgi:quercetin dioxygenase-like cupin family protein